MPADYEQRAGVTVISTAVPVLASHAAELGHRENHDIVHAVAHIGHQCGNRAREIVEPGVQGVLVPIGDPAQLSQALIAAWCGEKPFDGRPFPPPAIFSEMQTAVAVRNFLELAGSGVDEPLRRAA